MQNKKIISMCTLAALLITSSTTAINVKAESVTVPQTTRLWGSDRCETAVKISQAGWEKGADYAVIASGDGYSDALCAVPLAKVNNAPVLLARNGVLSESTLAELKRLNAKHVYIIGGQQVISKETEDQIKSQLSADVQRLYGQNRYETSAKVAEKLGTTGKIILASGDGYADALSAVPVAAIEGMPILLTESSKLSESAAEYIKGHSEITKTYVIGGAASVSEAAMNSVPSPQRIGGNDRFETNVAITNAFASDYNFDNVYLALAEGPVGDEFADALTGSALGAKNKQPMIITGKSLNSVTTQLLKDKLKYTSTVTIIGGAANISEEYISNMKEKLDIKKPNNGGSSSSGGGSNSSTSAITKLISSILSVIDEYDLLPNGVEVKHSGKKVTVTITNDTLKKKTISQLYAENFLNKIKTTEYSASKQAAVDNYIFNKITVQGQTLKEFLISKLEKKTHTQSVINYLKNPSKETYDALRSNLINNYDTYNEIVAVFNENFDITTAKKVPTVTIAGETLTKILIDNDSNHNDTDSEIIPGNSYTESQIKTMLGIKSTIGAATLSDLSGKYIGFQFSDSGVYWISFDN